MKMDRTLTGFRTDSKSVPRVCVPLTSAKSIASTVMGGTGDGLQPSPTNRVRSLALAPSCLFPERAAMSYRAIAAALALEDLSVGQRLAAFSLASFANRQHRAWPSAGTAAARAGLRARSTPRRPAGRGGREVPQAPRTPAAHREAPGDARASAVPPTAPRHAGTSPVRGHADRAGSPAHPQDRRAGARQPRHGPAERSSPRSQERGKGG